METLSSELVAKRDHLLDLLRSMRRVVVAFSGGVDSCVVAAAAFRSLGENALAVTADSPSVARRELDDATRLARTIGIGHRVIKTQEFDEPAYVRNAGDRCYHCKTELYTQVRAMTGLPAGAIVVSGANRDDAGDYRPGLTAAAEQGIRHPLQEAGFTKVDVRALARHWGLDVWDKPAAPCLSSRIAPGVEVTIERTNRIEAAESLLRALGLRDCRVRLHEGELARIEVPADEVETLACSAVRQRLTEQLRGLGFRFVTLDLEGLRSGNLNQLVALETRRRFEAPS